MDRESRLAEYRAELESLAFEERIANLRYAADVASLRRGQRFIYKDEHWRVAVACADSRIGTAAFGEIYYLCHRDDPTADQATEAIREADIWTVEATPEQVAAMMRERQAEANHGQNTSNGARPRRDV